jgi:hypothetical protein
MFGRDLDRLTVILIHVGSGLLTPMSALTLDEWEIPRDRVVINRYTSK